MTIETILMQAAKDLRRDDRKVKIAQFAEWYRPVCPKICVFLVSIFLIAFVGACINVNHTFTIMLFLTFLVLGLITFGLERFAYSVPTVERARKNAEVTFVWYNTNAKVALYPDKN